MNELLIYANAGEIALLGSLMRSRGIPIRTVWRYGISGVVPGLAVPSTHVHLAKQVFKETANPDLKMFTLREYRRRRQIFLIAMAVSVFLSVGLLFWLKYRQPGGTTLVSPAIRFPEHNFHN